jgi:Fuc2NAc and GlcNAc transferase
MASASIFLLLAGLLAVVTLSWALTGVIHRHAIRIGLIDVPNSRSSHTAPTPRGGGVAIVVSFLALLFGLRLADLIERNLMIAAVGAGALVAVLGFLDDRIPIPARQRFLGHAIAAAWSLWWLGPLPRVPLFGLLVDLSFATSVLCWLYVVWMINLFNFMDGIDGIASVEAITTALSGALLWWLAGTGNGWMAAVVFACCVAGFLVWNWPPAKIFMGDAGSGFLGLMVALLALWCGQATPALFWSWFILVGCFMVDGTTTLVRRVRRGERFFEAHRTHAYQHASRRAGRHLPVTLACGAINVLWLLPIASLVALGRLDGALGVVVAYAPLLWLAFRYKAGDRAAQKV